MEEAESIGLKQRIMVIVTTLLSAVGIVLGMFRKNKKIVLIAGGVLSAATLVFVIIRKLIVKAPENQ